MSRKLKRQVTLEEVHSLCEYLSFMDHYETLTWIERAAPEELEEKLRLAKKRRRKKETADEQLYVYVA